MILMRPADSAGRLAEGGDRIGRPCLPATNDGRAAERRWRATPARQEVRFACADARLTNAGRTPQQRLYFSPLPHGQRLVRPSFGAGSVPAGGRGEVIGDLGNDAVARGDSRETSKNGGSH